MRIHFEPLNYFNLEFLRLIRNENKEWFFDTSEVLEPRHFQWAKKELMQGNLNYVIVDSLSSERVGFISVYNITLDGYASIGRMMVSNKFKHQGYMLSAMIKIFDMCKEFFRIRELRLEVKLDNIIARDLYTKMGFTTTGYTKNTLIMKKSL